MSTFEVRKLSDMPPARHGPRRRGALRLATEALGPGDALFVRLEAPDTFDGLRRRITSFVTECDGQFHTRGDRAGGGIWIYRTDEAAP